MEKITEKTLVPLSLLGAMVGGIFWLTSMYNQTLANTESVKEIIKKQDSYSEDLHLIKMELSEIKGELKRIKR